MNLDQALLERRRLRRLWSAFLTDYQVCIGPTWANRPWPIDTDLDPDIGIQTLKRVSFLYLLEIAWDFLLWRCLWKFMMDYRRVSKYILSYIEKIYVWLLRMIQDEVPSPTPIDPV